MVHILNLPVTYANTYYIIVNIIRCNSVNAKKARKKISQQLGDEAQMCQNELNLKEVHYVRDSANEFDDLGAAQSETVKKIQNNRKMKF